MSTSFQSPFHSPQAQPTHSTPTKSSFLQPSINASKIQQKIERKSPKTSKEKKSPSKKSSLKIQNDPKLNGVLINDKDIDHLHGPLTSKKDSRKNHQSLKDDKPKLSIIPENRMNFDNRIENKVRKSDHQIIFSNYETGVPFKQKSHSVKSVSVPQELLLQSPPAYDPAFLEAVNRKLETMKHVNRNEIEQQQQQAMHSTDLLSLYNKQTEESKGNKYFSSNNNIPGDHYTIWPENKSKQQKNTLQKNPQNLDTNPYSINKTSQSHSGNDDQPTMTPVLQPKIKTPEGSPPSKTQKEVKKKAPVKFSPRVSDPSRISVGQGNSKIIQSQRASHQGHQEGPKFSNNYMLEPPKSVQKPAHESFEALESAKDDHNRSKSPSRKKSPGSSAKKTLTKESERNRTCSIQDQVQAMMITHETNIDSKTSENIRSSKYTDPSTFSGTNAYTNSVNERRNKRASDSQVREYDSLHSFKDNYILSTRSAIGGRQEHYHGVNVQTEGNETFNDADTNVPVVTKSVKFNKDALQFQTQQQKENNHDDKTDQIVSDLLKANTLREFTVNPNAKFLQLRKQVHDKRSKLAFKSVDWNGEQAQFQQSETHQASPIREPSISPALSPILSASHEMRKSPHKETKSIESATLLALESITKEQLFLLFNKTKMVLSRYKNREKDWEKERKMFIAEIKRLRELAMKGLKC